MANMSYCRFENTANDLEDCYDHLGDEDLSDSEKRARGKLIDYARRIVEATEEEDI